MTEPSRPWDRQPEETPRAFDAFRAYALLGPSRSLAKVGQEWGGKRTQLERWSSRWAWVARARAWDDEQARVEDRAWRERARTHARRHADAAASVLARLVDALDRVDWSGSSPLDLVRALDLASKVECRALGAPAQAQPVTLSGPDGQPLAVTFGAMTDEQRAERLDVLIREAEKRRDIAQEDARRSVEARTGDGVADYRAEAFGDNVAVARDRRTGAP
ncbi:hypothetical protein [Cellulosimicrobium protaetiae]